jgi:hypothetical protein
MPEDFVIEAVTKTYYGCKVTAFKNENTKKYYPAFPWRFTVKHNGIRYSYVGIPNYVESKAGALKRGWYRAKWLTDGTYQEKYR